jgi:CBS domain-containing protein
MTSQSRGPELIDTYNRLIEWFKTKIDREDHRTAPYPAGLEYVTRNKLLSDNKIRRLNDYRGLRNAIVHSTSPTGGKRGFIAEPTEEALREFKALVDEIINPPTVMNVAIKGDQIYTTTLEALAIEVMKEMTRKSYSHVPVMLDNKIVGVFSENTVFSFIAAADDVVHSGTRIEEFRAHLPIHEHFGESFLVLSEDVSLAEAYRAFSNAKEKNVRVGAIFVTATGKWDQSLLGMITAWDLAGADYF